MKNKQAKAIIYILFFTKLPKFAKWGWARFFSGVLPQVCRFPLDIYKLKM